MNCAVCLAITEEAEYQFSLTANSSEVIELARRPAADKGKSQKQTGRAIRYVDSEMRIMDALQASCAAMRSYRLATSQGFTRLARMYSRDGDLLDVDGLDETSVVHRKLKSICEEFVEEKEQAVITEVKAGKRFSDACFGPKSPCGASRKVCAPGTYSLDGETGLAPCWPCSQGTYQDQGGKGACVTCPSGTSSSPGSAAKSECKPVCSQGEWSATGTVPCRPCDQGSFKSSAGVEPCTPCTGGNGTLREGATSASECMPICGDSFLSPSEACDDGNTRPMDGCSSTCTIEQGYECTSTGGGRRGPAQTCRKSFRGCGDGKRESPEEECDDGNTQDKDGCSARCKIEEGYVCTKRRAGGKADECTRVEIDRKKTGDASRPSRLNGRKLPKPPPMPDTASDFLNHSVDDRVSFLIMPQLPSLESLFHGGAGSAGGALVTTYKWSTLLLPDTRRDTKWARAFWNDIKVSSLSLSLSVCVLWLDMVYLSD
jgi:cysteine-rich repeat protein